MSPPIRFLTLVVGGWAAIRVFVHLPSGEAPIIRPASVETRTAQAAHLPTRPQAETATIRHEQALLERASPTLPTFPTAIPQVRAATRQESVVDSTSVALVAQDIAFAMPGAEPRSTENAIPFEVASRMAPALPALRPKTRLSGSAWMLARGGDEVAAAASNGLLGGSQGGARLLYRVNDDISRPLSLSARATSPLRHQGMEAAVGVEWQPLAAAPVRILAERRQRVTGNGRSAFALLAHGGVSDRPIAAGLLLDAYAQAGVVGLQSRDLFADAGATLFRPLNAAAPDGFAVGAGAWGGVQPGAARLDVGPRVSTTINAASRRARVSLDWRFRVSGSAAPASGPALTVDIDF